MELNDDAVLWTVSTERQRAMWARAYDRKLARDAAAAAEQRLCMRLRCGRVMDLKVEHVAEKAGCGVRTVRRWVRGKGQPSPEVYAKLCAAICGCGRCMGFRRGVAS
jgi:transcriptional regulator with XRE-family HTH domain